MLILQSLLYAKMLKRKELKENNKVYKANLNNVNKVRHKNLQKLQNGNSDLKSKLHQQLS